MKNLLIGFISLVSFAAMAHNIEGTLVLKGAIKTNILINNVKTDCKVKVEKVLNLRDEDDFGNPGYNVKMNIALDGTDSKSSTTIKYSKTQQYTNMFVTNGKKEVRDFDYAAEDGSTLKIDNQGRIRGVTFDFQDKKITCSF